MKNKEVLENAIQTWGETAQIDMAIEEMSELIFALSKVKRNYTSETIKNCIEEIADVKLMMDQMSLMFGKKEVKQIKKEKIKRLEKRLEKFG